MFLPFLLSLRGIKYFTRYSRGAACYVSRQAACVSDVHYVLPGAWGSMHLLHEEVGHHLCILPDASRSKIRSKCHITNTWSLLCKNSAYKNVTVCVNVQRRRDTLSRGLWLCNNDAQLHKCFYSKQFFKIVLKTVLKKDISSWIMSLTFFLY